MDTDTNNTNTNSTSDVTYNLINDASYVWRSRLSQVKPAKSPLPKTLQQTLDQILSNPYMGFISNALTYSKIVYGARERQNLMRLVKGGFLRVTIAQGPAPDSCKDRQTGSSYHYRLEKCQ